MIDENLKLSDLAMANEYYKAKVAELDKKLEVVQLWIKKEHFFQEEIERIKDRFVLPATVTVGGDFKIGAFFSYDKYVRYAYDTLKMGYDVQIKSIVQQAENEYVTVFGHNQAQISQTIGTGMLEKSVITHLTAGVGYILYEQLLRVKLEELTKPKTMSRYFEIERRTTFERPYLKVFLRDGVDYAAIAGLLTSRPSIKTANVTEQRSGKKDLTIYPARTYEIEEVEQEVELTLTNYFNGNPNDPVFKEEALSALSEKAYFQIIDHILRLGKNLEVYKALNVRFDEEGYRDYFLPFLNALSVHHTAKGEVFNWAGKTDILIVDQDGRNIFVAECKLWKGEAYLLSAIDQLLTHYVSWRDERTAIIIFNRENKKFSEVVEKAIAAVSQHPLCAKALGQRKDGSYSYLFKNPSDENKTINVELILLNFA